MPNEPGIKLIVCCSGLAGKVAALQRFTGTTSRTTANHFSHHAVHDVGIARVDNSRRVNGVDQHFGKFITGATSSRVACSRRAGTCIIHIDFGLHFGG